MHSAHVDPSKHSGHDDHRDESREPAPRRRREHPLPDRETGGERDFATPDHGERDEPRKPANRR